MERLRGVPNEVREQPSGLMRPTLVPAVVPVVVVVPVAVAVPAAVALVVDVAAVVVAHVVINNPTLNWGRITVESCRF